MIQEAVKDRFDAVRGLGSDDILAALGLERRRSALDVLLPAVGVFAAGVVFGTGVALLLAPKAGRELRRDIKGKASELTHLIGESAEGIAQEVRDSLTQKAEESGVTKALENGTRAERKSGDSVHRAASDGAIK